ncbi:hypothetical protein [Desulfitobacterium chlororespirans]|uniref:DUF4367 domain-containing protein n=1 Tax=Desulfitobacterium chlororespirans DSM 11544 TaxID=1121395 RepID=A0A1M7SPR8_9FIRM|nr:hypothetical protein [Desulfitobacterium chlororespirans]SHN60501.1 hypothetical protein SAMN02745215_01180 [Desulfitobacterium chlororespirans DSM 11544]
MTKKCDLKEFDEVCSLLTNAEVDADRHKEKIYNRARLGIETGINEDYNKRKDDSYMRKNYRKAAAAVIASVCLIGGLSTTAYAQEIFQSVLARCQVGGIEIVQRDKELPEVSPNTDNTRTPRENTQKSATPEEAREAMKVDFKLPVWLPEGFAYANSVIHTDKAVEIQYAKDSELISLLISKGENGISTTGEVKKETLAGKTVYFVNDIILWEQDGLNYELYYLGQQDLDNTTLEKLLNTMVSGQSYNEAKAFYLQNGVPENELDKAISISVETDNMYRQQLGEYYDQLKSGTITREEAAKILEAQGK